MTLARPSLKTPPPYILNLSCPDRMGVVAAVAAFLTENDANITEAGQFNDQVENAFFMRAAFSPAGPRFPEEAVLRERFGLVAT